VIPPFRLLLLAKAAVTDHSIFFPLSTTQEPA